MHRNTYFLLLFLAVFAAIVVGVHIIKPTARIPPTPILNQTTVKPPGGPTPKPINRYVFNACGISLPIPTTHTVMEGSGNSIVLTNATVPGDTIIVSCQKNIPRPALTDDKQEKLKSGSVTATLYHDTSANDGTPIDKLIFTNPKTGLDVFFSGSGESFNEVISSIQIL